MKSGMSIDCVTTRVSLGRMAVPLASLLAATAMLGPAVPGTSEAAVTLTGRSTVNHVEYMGGFAIAGDEGEDGSLTPLTAWSPADSTVAGRHDYDGSYLFWDVHYDVDWNQNQSFALTGPASGVNALHAWGDIHLAQSSIVTGLNGPFPATVQITGTNTQTFEFSLDSQTRFALNGTTTGGEWVEFLIWNDAAQRWFPVQQIGPLSTTDRQFSFEGTVGAGLYRVGSMPYTLRADGNSPEVFAAWDYTLTFPGTVITAVPEPSSALLLASGLLACGVIGTRKRPRAIRPD